ncbi:MAG: hypothetical protein ABS36_04655 [Acidobacteria bacterium SCN 69-37]|nr:MAG: hypothetical protein ABS36_04655 [Acidobacteria bacterium SCN 69-37]
MHRVRRSRRLAPALGTLLLVLVVGPAAQAPDPVRPTAPPPDAPAPGSRCLGCGVAPEPVAPDDDAGWRSIFDGRSLDGWDGNPAVWRVEDGAITAETWPDRRVGTTFLIWRGGEPADFELKLDIKADYDIHSGVFYRSTVGPTIARSGGPSPARGAGSAPGPGRTGATPALGRATQAPFAVPADARWNVRGYGIDWDWDPGNNGNVQDVGTGRAEAQIGWRGYIVRTTAGARPRALGTLGDREALMQVVRLGEWNQLHIIAHGRQLTHLVNGHVMAILIDDDPAGLKTKGVIALQIEQFGQGRVSFRNIRLKE